LGSWDLLINLVDDAEVAGEREVDTAAPLDGVDVTGGGLQALDALVDLGFCFCRADCASVVQVADKQPDVAGGFHEAHFVVVEELAGVSQLFKYLVVEIGCHRMLVGGFEMRR
jgi:hypothetical protein